MNEFIDLELQSEVANLRAENKRLQRRLGMSALCLTAVLADVAKGSFFQEGELSVLRRLTSGYQVSKSDQVVLDKLNIKEPDEAIDFQPVSSYGYGNNDGSTEANS